MSEPKRFTKGQVIVVNDRPALITQVGGDGTDTDTSTVYYDFIESGGTLTNGHHFRGEWEMADVKIVDFAKVKTVVDLPPEWQAKAQAYEVKKGEADRKFAERRGEWAPETHPSYGSITVNRVSGHTSLFGSAFKHQHYMKIGIGRSTRQRSHGQDWHMGSIRGELVEVAMSEAQWARFVSSVNTSGVPCTLQYVGGRRMENCPEQESVERYHEDIRRDMEQATKFMSEAIAQLTALRDDKAPSKAKRQEALTAVIAAHAKLVDAAPYKVEQLQEHMETIVEAAKTEVEAYVHNTIVESGIQRLKEVNTVKLLELGPPRADEE